jgi:dipeptide/tripeptide permease
LTKLLPVIVIEKLPAVMDIGETLAMTGVGFHSVTALWPAALESASLAAWMVTLFGLGRVAGAV